MDDRLEELKRGFGPRVEFRVPDSDDWCTASRNRTVYDGNHYDIFMNGDHIGKIGRNGFKSISKGEWRTEIWIWSRGSDTSDELSCESVYGYGGTPVDAVRKTLCSEISRMRNALAEFEALGPVVFLDWSPPERAGGPGKRIARPLNQLAFGKR
jgi:hypothetical protein